MDVSLLNEIADYVRGFSADGAEARRIARYCLMDTLACGFQALKYPACTRMLGCHLVDGAGHWVQQEQPEQPPLAAARSPAPVRALRSADAPL